MKCAQCILENLVDRPLNDESMQYAIDGARTAVTSVKGNALCGQHLMTYLLEDLPPNIRK
jgi:hypothetical protein